MVQAKRIDLFPHSVLGTAMYVGRAAVIHRATVAGAVASGLANALQPVSRTVAVCPRAVVIGVRREGMDLRWLAGELGLLRKRRA